MKVKVVLEDVGAKKNGAKTWIAQKYSLACLRVKVQSRCLWVGGSCWGKRIELELADKAWAHKKNSFYKFSQSHVKKCLSQIRISLWLIAPPQKGKMRHHWGSRKNKCQVATLNRSYVSLYNGKQNAICTSSCRVVGCNYTIKDHKGLKWKAPNAFNVETHV